MSKFQNISLMSWWLLLMIVTTPIVLILRALGWITVNCFESDFIVGVEYYCDSGGDGEDGDNISSGEAFA